MEFGNEGKNVSSKNTVILSEGERSECFSNERCRAAVEGPRFLFVGEEQ
jgi:hypothetical protein